MKIVLDVRVDRQLKDGDMIIFHKGNWKIVPKQSLINPYLIEQEKKNKNYEDKINKLEKNLLDLSKIVKEK